MPGIYVDLIVKYAKDKMIVLKEFAVNKGELILLTGKNGSGKSTILRVLGKQISNDCYEGRLENSFISISYLPERFSLPKLMRSSHFIAEFNSLLPKYEIKFLMDRYHIQNRRISTLSKGMIQKVGLVSVLSKKADLFLFDEPLSGLDLHSKRMFREDISHLLAAGKTVIISTHYPRFFKALNAISFNFKNGVKDERDSFN